MSAHIWKAASRSRTIKCRLPLRSLAHARFLTTDSRDRLSKFWAPTGGISPQDGEQDDSHALLVRGGFLRQAHSGVFHLLPLGLRVQSKLESLIEKHMSSIYASKLSLSALSTETLWQQSGRYSSHSELLRVTDRKESGFLLSPTHEEEITALVASMVHSYKDLPLRLYQIGRKYRDERRPRQGLLRAKEFLMKDLYTFDASNETALATYESVRRAYGNLFDELKIPYLVADADSGNMGGKLSHEYHFVSPKGEDNVWTCSSCDYIANEELVEKGTVSTQSTEKTEPVVFTGISTDYKTAIHIHIPRPESLAQDQEQKHKDEQESKNADKITSLPWTQVSNHVNLHAVKRALPPTITLDTGIEPSTLLSRLSHTESSISIYDASLTTTTTSPTPTDLTPILPNSPCPHCSTGTLTPHRAIEIAHTFHLGTRYSAPLNALIATPHNATKQPLHMGCHGIGVSRLLGALAGMLADERGLNWPRMVAPWEVAVIFNAGAQAESHAQSEAEGVYDALRAPRTGTNTSTLSSSSSPDDNTTATTPDVLLDDRPDKSLGWKLRDADLIGYPIVVVMGRGWRERREVEVQCRRLGVKMDVGAGEVGRVVDGLLAQL